MKIKVGISDEPNHSSKGIASVLCIAFPQCEFEFTSQSGPSCTLEAIEPGPCLEQAAAVKGARVNVAARANLALATDLIRRVCREKHLR